MPIYEYKCKNCGAQIEKMQKISDAPLTVCEKCGGELEKQWSLSGFQFKGAGWYVSDYSNKLKDPSGGKSTTATKTETTEKAEKTSAAESTTAAAPSASNTSSDSTTTSSKKD